MIFFENVDHTAVGVSAVNPLPVTGNITVSALATAPLPVSLGESTAIAVSAVAAAGTGQVPGDTFPLLGGNGITATALTVTNTKVVSAAVVAGGTGGTPGAVTITGTTGTGTPFQATGTINAGGILTGALVVSVPGDYTVNPTNIAIEPVTGGSLSGATVSVVMGVLTAEITAGGQYAIFPTNPVAQGISSGSGISATFTMAYSYPNSPGNQTYNTAANTTGYQVKTGVGVFKGFSVNIVGITSSATFYDGTSAAGKKLGAFSTLAQVSLQFEYNFAAGLFVVLAGGTAADVTVAYR